MTHSLQHRVTERAPISVRHVILRIKPTAKSEVANCGGLIRQE